MSHAMHVQGGYVLFLRQQPRPAHECKSLFRTNILYPSRQQALVITCNRTHGVSCCEAIPTKS